MLHTHKGTEEILFVEVSAADASRMMDLSQEEQYVFHIIKNSKDVGLWTREIKKYSKISGQNELTNILKKLLQKKLVKQVKDIQNKTQKKYMLFDCEPSDKMTGGPWYTNDAEFDFEFYTGTEKLVLQTVKHLTRPQSTMVCTWAWC